MARFANGKYAFGFCDLMVGRNMLDEDQPQNFLGRLGDYADPEAIKDPRPDTSQDNSRKLYAFDPVGNGNAGATGNIIARGHAGNVKVTT